MGADSHIKKALQAVEMQMVKDGVHFRPSNKLLNTRSHPSLIGLSWIYLNTVPRVNLLSIRALSGCLDGCVRLGE